MTSRQLTIVVDAAGLRTLAASAQRIALVKSATNPAYAVVWQAIAPVENNTVAWGYSYEVYASTTALTPGARLQTGSTASATGGNTYTFAAGMFDAGTADLPLSDWGIRNNDSEVSINGVRMLTGGLSQAAVVNGQPLTTAVDGQAVPFQERAVTTATEQVVVFAAGGVVAGSVLDRRWLAAAGGGDSDIVLGPALVVDLTTVTDRAIRYSDSSNSFVPA